MGCFQPKWLLRVCAIAGLWLPSAIRAWQVQVGQLKSLFYFPQKHQTSSSNMLYIDTVTRGGSAVRMNLKSNHPECKDIRSIKQRMYSCNAARQHHDRRIFLLQSSSIMMTFVSSTSQLAYAEDGESAPIGTKDVEAVDLMEKGEHKATARPDVKVSEMLEDNTKEIKSSTLGESREKDVISDIMKDEIEEEMAMKDTKKLIDKLEEQLKAEDSLEIDGKSSEPISPQREGEIMNSTKNLIDNLEKEEEKIRNDTEALITKIENLGMVENESKLKGQIVEFNAADSNASQEIVNKLKERIEEKEDLIARLKRESEKDIDPKTGKFKVMTRKEFKERKSSDVDLIEFLRESNEEFKRDLEAFEGLLESKFGPLAEEILKNAKELESFEGLFESKIDPVLGEARKNTGPVLDEMRNSALPAVEGAVNDMLKGSGSVIEEVRKNAAPVVEGALDELRKSSLPAIEGAFQKLRKAAEEAL